MRRYLLSIFEKSEIETNGISHDSCRRKMRMWMRMWMCAEQRANAYSMNVPCHASCRWMQTRCKLKCCILLGWPHKAQHTKVFTAFVCRFCLLLLWSVYKSCCYLGACLAVSLCVCVCVCVAYEFYSCILLANTARFSILFSAFLSLSLSSSHISLFAVAILFYCSTRLNQVQWLRFGLR